MELVVVSCSHDVENEIAIVEAMLLEGLQSFHLRKPHYTTNDYITYLSKVSPKLRNRIVLHSRHMLANKYACKGVHVSRKHRRAGFRTKFRLFKLRFFNKKIHISAGLQSVEAMEEVGHQFDYIFLGPVFENIEPDARIKRFKTAKLKKYLRKAPTKVFAHGGISPDKFEMIYKLGFDGIAAQSYIWDSEDPLQTYFQLKEKLIKTEEVMSTQAI